MSPPLEPAELDCELRESCTACTKARRRCDAGLGICGRCEERGLECCYELAKKRGPRRRKPETEAARRKAERRRARRRGEQNNGAAAAAWHTAACGSEAGSEVTPCSSSDFGSTTSSDEWAAVDPVSWAIGPADLPSPTAAHGLPHCHIPVPFAWQQPEQSHFAHYPANFAAPSPYQVDFGHIGYPLGVESLYQTHIPQVAPPPTWTIWDDGSRPWAGVSGY